MTADSEPSGSEPSGSEPSGSEPCPDTEALCGMVEGRLGNIDRAVLERHLEGCSLCRRALIEVGRAMGHEAPARATSHRPPSLSDSPSSAQKLGRYEIRREVGLGGMGVVYEGWDPALGRRVALKLMRPDKLQLVGPNATEQLAIEAKALATIAHPNVLTVFDVGIEGDAVFIAAEYIEGVTMDKGWPHRARSWRDRLDAYLDVARGLAAIHAAGVTHRDIKPSNILLSHDGRVKIADFGLAVKAGQQASPGGTPAYMAPEQARGEATPAADQYALAVCMAEALLGARLSSGISADDLATKAAAVWGKQGPPRELWLAIARALSEAPAARFASVDAFVAALEQAVSETRVMGPRRPMLAWGAGALLIGALAAGGIAYAARQSSTVASASSLAAATVAPGELFSTAAPPENSDDAKRAPSGEVAAAGDSAASLEKHGLEKHSLEKQSVEKHGLEKQSVEAASPKPAPRSNEAPAAVTSAPPENPVLAAIAQQDEANKLLAQLPDTLRTKDGKKCMALIAEAKKLAPHIVSGLSTTIATCEMMSGKCDQGVQRVANEKNLGSSSKLVAEQMRAQYCPASSSQSTPQERLKSVFFQAGSGPFTAARCEQFVAQTEKAIKDHGSEKPDGTVMSGAWSSTAMCFAWVGNCARAKQIMGKLISGLESEEKIAKWVKQAHPNCAKGD